MLKQYSGSLTKEQMADISYQHPTNEIANIIAQKNGIPFLCHSMKVSNAYVGLQVRTPYTYITKLEARDCFSDLIAVRTGDFHVGFLYAKDTHEYVYSKYNHKDVFQIYNFCSVTNKHLKEPVQNVSINKALIFTGGENKHIINCTEVCGYEKFTLFDHGCEVFDVGKPSKLRYLINTINAVDWVIGSPEHPLDPKKIGDRIIRIAGVKPGSPPSNNIEIHARPGLRLELDSSARMALKLTEYPYEHF